MIQNTSFEASDFFFRGGGSMPPDPSRTYEAGCGVYKFLKKSAPPPPRLSIPGSATGDHIQYLILRSALGCPTCDLFTYTQC